MFGSVLADACMEEAEELVSLMHADKPTDTSGAAISVRMHFLNPIIGPHLL
jgi:hypothetical protein